MLFLIYQSKPITEPVRAGLAVAHHTAARHSPVVIG
jgi:hypothetical protein